MQRIDWYIASSVGYADEWYVYNNTPNYNTSAQVFSLVTLNSTNSFNTVQFDFTGTGVKLNFSCNNGTNWAQITTNGGNANCPNSQTSKCLFI